MARLFGNQNGIRESVLYQNFFLLNGLLQRCKSADPDPIKDFIASVINRYMRIFIPLRQFTFLPFGISAI